MISLATMDDMARVGGLAAWYFHKLGCIGRFDGVSFMRSWQDLMRHGVGFIMQRTNGTPEPHEAMGVLIYPDPCTGQRVAATAFWYAQDDISMAAGMLHERVQREAKERGAVRLFVAGMMNERYDKVAKYLLHAGYKPVEVHYVKEL